MKMSELVKAGAAFRKIINQEIGIRTAYNLAKMIKPLDIHLNFYDKKRMQIIDKHYNREDGKLVPKSPEDFEKAQTEMTELLELEIELEGIEKVIIPESEKINISVNDMLVLSDFIEIKFTEE